MATVFQEFQSAPMGRRVWRVTGFAFLSYAVLVAFYLVFASRWRAMNTEMAVHWITTLAPLLGPVLTAPFFFFERTKVSRFSIADNNLVLGKKSYPLAGLVSAERDPKIMCWAFKKYGNDGLGAIRGRFWSKRVGKFEAFLTGTENAVVLRWPDRVVAVSPADPEFFITCARSAAGLR
jgi:hypothetical protein